MATTSKKKSEDLRGTTGIQPIQQGMEDNQTKTAELIFTPEQRKILGQAYQLILSWRLEPKMPSVPTTADGDTDKITATSDRARTLEVGA